MHLLGFVCGNTKELQARRKKRQQRSLFCLKKWKEGLGSEVRWGGGNFSLAYGAVRRPLKELLIRIILWSFSFLLKRRHLFCLLPAFFVLHENWRDSISFQSSRSTNRSRCSRLIASSFGQNGCKGSRQNGSVTLEERVALEVEEVGWCTGDFRLLWVGKASVSARELGRFYCRRGFRTVRQGLVASNGRQPFSPSN